MFLLHFSLLNLYIFTMNKNITITNQGMIAIVIILSINKSREISPTTFIFVLFITCSFHFFKSFDKLFLL